jgi:aspartyl aminopeptidase
MIPNCSIHYNRELNKVYAFNPQNEKLPILTDDRYNSDLLALIAKELNVEKGAIISYDLYLALLDKINYIYNSFSR